MDEAEARAFLGCLSLLSIVLRLVASVAGGDMMHLAYYTVESHPYANSQSPVVAAQSSESERAFTPKAKRSQLWNLQGLADHGAAVDEKHQR